MERYAKNMKPVILVFMSVMGILFSRFVYGDKQKEIADLIEKLNSYYAEERMNAAEALGEYGKDAASANRLSAPSSIFSKKRADGKD